MNQLMPLLSTLLRAHRPFATITIIDHGGSVPREIGAKLVLTPDGDFAGTIGGGELERQLLEQARELLISGRPHCQKVTIPLSAKTGQCCGGVVEALIEVFAPGIPFYIFGAGHVGEQIATILNDTPFRPILVDERPEWPRLEITKSGVTIMRSLDSALHEIKATPDFHAAVLTHSHELDFQITSALLPLPFRYLGLIGSHTKRQRFDRRLLDAGISAEQLARLDCPMGIDLGGGKSPREVAISLAAKILSVHYRASHA